MPQPVKNATVGIPARPAITSGTRSRNGVAVIGGKVRPASIHGAGKRRRRPLFSGIFLNNSAEKTPPSLAMVFISFGRPSTAATPLPKLDRPCASAMRRRAAATISSVGTLFGHWA